MLKSLFSSILVVNRKPLLFPSNIKAIITFIEKNHIDMKRC